MPARGARCARRLSVDRSSERREGSIRQPTKVQRNLERARGQRTGEDSFASGACRVGRVAEARFRIIAEAEKDGMNLRLRQHRLLGVGARARASTLSVPDANLLIVCLSSVAP